MSTATQLITPEEFDKLPEPEDGSKMELIEGEIVTMGLPEHDHSAIAKRILRFLVGKLGWDQMWPDKTGYKLGRTEVAPDVSCAFEDQPVNDGLFVGAPMVAIEVLSPNEETQTRISLYLRHGAKEVWLVSRELRLLIVCKPGTRVEYDNEYHSEALDLTITLADIFGA